MNTQQRIINMVSYLAGVPVSQICATTNFKEDLELDSIDYMLLIVKLEKWFKVELTSEEVERIETVKDANTAITRYLAVQR